MGRGAAALAGNEEPVGVEAVPPEDDEVASGEALVLDVAAPAFGEDVALAAAPVGVAEAPELASLFLVLEAEEEALVGGGGGHGEVLLRVLLRDHEPVQLPDIARSQRLLEHRLSLAAVGGGHDLHNGMVVRTSGGTQEGLLEVI